MSGTRRCRADADFGVWWCDPPAQAVGPPWLTIVFLHGWGEVGEGTAEALAQIGCGGGLPREIEQPDMALLHDPTLFPFLVVAPQTASRWERELERVERLVQRLTDSGFVRGRPVLTGFSIGGDGVWSLGAQLPFTFSALAPVASEDPPDAKGVTRAIASMPIWIAYRGDDQNPSRRRPTAVIDALAKTGNAELEVCEYVGPPPPKWTPHAYAARQAYTDPRFYGWLRDRAE
jgi:predicted peptidase